MYLRVGDWPCMELIFCCADAKCLNTIYNFTISAKFLKSEIMATKLPYFLIQVLFFKGALPSIRHWKLDRQPNLF